MQATANHKNRTFTLRTNGNKYRTEKMNKVEFQEALNNTESDWKDFLKKGIYTVVK